MACLEYFEHHAWHMGQKSKISNEIRKIGHQLNDTDFLELQRKVIMEDHHVEKTSWVIEKNPKDMNKGNKPQ